MKTQLSITEAAKLVGVERSTLYRHIDEKGISVIKTEGSHPKIDVSELIRVYGDKINPSRLDKKKDNKEENATKDNTNSDTDGFVALGVKERLEIIENERERERKQYQQQIDHLKDLLESEQEERKKFTALLTDQRNSKKDDEIKQNWQKSIKALEQRIANQEKTAKEKADREERILRQNLALKRALEAERKKSEEERRRIEEERNKSWLQKLFG